MSYPNGSQPIPRVGGDIVTGEAVVLEIREAKLPSRFIAKLLDLLLQFGLFLVAAFLLGALSLGLSLDDAAGVAISLILYISIWLGYPVVFETLSRGRTLGKMALGLRVVRDDGGPAGFRQALVRALMGIFEVWLTFGVLAVLVSAFSPRGKRIGDYLAGTVVVRERMPTQSAPMVQMPPMLAGWARDLDLSRLPDDLALSARQFMARATSLTASVRDTMGRRIAYDVSRFVSPAPPNGLHPELYLSAVLAERRRRDEARYPAGPQTPVALSNWPQSAPMYVTPAPPQPTLPTPHIPTEREPGSGFVAPF